MAFGAGGLHVRPVASDVAHRAAQSPYTLSLSAFSAIAGAAHTASPAFTFPLQDAPISVKHHQDRQVAGRPLLAAPRFACNGCLQLTGPAGNARRRVAALACRPRS